MRGRLRSRNHFILICLLLIAATLAVYWQALGHNFINYDDDEYVTDNLPVRAGLTRQGIAWAFTAMHAGNWHPLTWISHMLDCQVYKLDPMGHHLTSLLLHIANTLLLFLVLGRMTGSVWRSGFVAGLFALHPLHVESVAWAAERKDVLSTFFWMLAMLAYVRYAENPKLGRYLPVVLFFALGLMAKPMLVTLPFVLLLLDYWPLGRFKSKERNRAWVGWRLVLEKAPLFVLSAASSAITYVAQRRSGAVAPLEELSLGVRAANAPVACMGYIKKMLWPRDLAIFYPHPGGTLPAWQVVGSSLLLACIFILLVWVSRGGRRRPYLAVGWLWYLGTLVPVIGLVQVGVQAMADRYTYVPLIGLFIVIGWGVPDLLTGSPQAGLRRDRITLLAVEAGLLISSLTVSTWFQVGCWRDSMTLFGHAAGVTEKNYLAYTNMGVALQELEKPREAIEQYSRALRINPDDLFAHYSLGVALMGLGEIDKAIFQYSETLRLNPAFAPAHNNLGNILLDRGQVDKAVFHYREALRLRPDDAKVHNNLASALYMKGNYAEAWKEVHLCEKYGLRPHPNIVKALLEKMPEPKE